MKRIKQVIIIFGIFFLSQYLKDTLNLIFPSSILGMLILTLLLVTRIVKVEEINGLTNILLGYLSFFFLPVFVTVKDSIIEIKDIIIPLLIIIFISTNITMIVTALVTQKLNNRDREV